MGSVELQWLKNYSTLKEALQDCLGCSGQLLKRFYSSKELLRPQEMRELVRLPLELVNHLHINPVYFGPDACILQETNDYLAIHKPSGIHSHPLNYNDQDTALNFLVQSQKWESLRINETHYDRGLLFRLDYETSGVLVLAKNQIFFDKMRGGFAQELKSKMYWAVVEGDFNQEGEWTHYFLATGSKGAKQSVLNEAKGEAIQGKLIVKKLMFSEGKSLLIIKLETGLRHQIRAQLGAIGFPLLGDELYGGKKSDRLFLHAWRYEWSESVEDNQAELFDRFFDLNRARQMSHDMLGDF